ncbi:MAG: hypothetical protein Q4G28_07055 [Neisseria sp.]|nr:hypothetical protein [Neisseria sp.]
MQPCQAPQQKFPVWEKAEQTRYHVNFLELSHNSIEIFEISLPEYQDSGIYYSNICFKKICRFIFIESQFIEINQYLFQIFHQRSIFTGRLKIFRRRRDCSAEAAPYARQNGAPHLSRCRHSRFM